MLKKSYEKIKHNLFKPIHGVFKLLVATFSFKDSKYKKIIESTIYEMRLMVLSSTLVLGIYFYINFVNDPNDSEIIKVIIKLSGLLVLLILFLTFRIAIKLNFKYQYHLCKNPDEICKCPMPPSSLKYVPREANLPIIPQTHSFHEHQLKIDHPEHDTIKERNLE